jgi:DnaJ-domain-containing protein 1
VQGRRQASGRDRPTTRPRVDEGVTIDLEAPPMTDDRAAEYREWAERLRRKRERARARIHATPPDEAPSYWTSDNVFRESQRIAREEVPRGADPLVQELLAVFGIVGEPTPRQIDTAFRRLAKEHHPDRHVGADDATRAYHLDQMRRINEAYSRLRQLQLT